jgi:hypothetical protein
MAQKHQRTLAYQSAAAAQAEATRATERRDQSERNLGAASQMLGTDEQIAGYGEDSRLAEYGQRYSLDGQAMSGYLNSHSKIARQGTQLREDYAGAISSANTLLEQAEAAAKAGDFDTAAQLKAQAGGGFGDRFSAAFKLGGGDPNAAAKGMLSSPAAQAVGSMVRDARSFQDWDSQASQQFRQNMVQPQERAIAASAEAAQRTARDFGLQRGAGRNAAGAVAINAEMQRKFGTERAQAHAQTNQFFEQYRRSFAQDAVGFAQAWLQGEAGVREQFQGAMDNLSAMGAELFTKTASMAANFSTQAAQQSAQKSAFRQELYGSLVGAVATLGSAGIAALGAAPAAAAATAGGTASSAAPMS